MLILSIRRAPPGAGGNTIAHFDAEISADCRLYNLALREYPDGERRTGPPNAYGRRVATFAPALATRLTAAASIALSELDANNESVAA